MNYPTVEMILAADKAEKIIHDKLNYHINKLYDLQSRTKEWGGDQYKSQIAEQQEAIKDLKDQLPPGTPINVKPIQTNTT